MIFYFVFYVIKDSGCDFIRYELPDIFTQNLAGVTIYNVFVSRY